MTIQLQILLNFWSRRLRPSSRRTYLILHHIRSQSYSNKTIADVQKWEMWSIIVYRLSAYQRLLYPYIISPKLGWGGPPWKQRQVKPVGPDWVYDRKLLDFFIFSLMFFSILFIQCPKIVWRTYIHSGRLSTFPPVQSLQKSDQIL